MMLTVALAVCCFPGRALGRRGRPDRPHAVLRTRLRLKGRRPRADVPPAIVALYRDDASVILAGPGRGSQGKGPRSRATPRRSLVGREERGRSALIVAERAPPLGDGYLWERGTLGEQRSRRPPARRQTVVIRTSEVLRRPTPRWPLPRRPCVDRPSRRRHRRWAAARTQAAIDVITASPPDVGTPAGKDETMSSRIAYLLCARRFLRRGPVGCAASDSLEKNDLG
jgi:hypothetical protein